MKCNINLIAYYFAKILVAAVSGLAGGLMVGLSFKILYLLLKNI